MTRFTVVLSKIAEEKLEILLKQNRKIGEQISKAIDRLALHPEVGEFLKGEWKGYRKYRSGDFRIIYRTEHSKLIIYIITVDDRKDAYR